MTFNQKIIELNTMVTGSLIVTHGENGAYYITDNTLYHVNIPQVKAVDTVGAGDAFTSVLILGITHGWPLDTTLQRAQSFASLIVGQQGATVQDQGFYRSMINDWNL